MDPSLYGYSIEDFREEARDLLSRAEGVLAEVRESPGDREKVNALFRVIHSLKGSAAYAGLGDVTAFAHIYESFLGELRNNKYEANPDVLNLLVRARDYMEDLIFHPDNTDFEQIDIAGDPMQSLAIVLKARKGSTGGLGIRSLAPPLGSIETESNVREVEMPVKSQKDEIVSASSESSPEPSKMGQSDVIKVAVTNAVRTLYSSIKTTPLDNELTARLLVKLEESILWAFGDKSSIIKPIEEMKEIMSGSVGPDEISKLRKRFNSLAIVIKSEIAALEGQENGKEGGTPEVTDKLTDNVQEKKKASAEAVRGASKDDIVKITLSGSLDALSAIIEERDPDYSVIKRISGRLKDLNRWAFNEDQRIDKELRALEELLRRPYDDRVAQNMRTIYLSIRPVFASLLDEKETGESGNKEIKEYEKARSSEDKKNINPSSQLPGFSASDIQNVGTDEPTGNGAKVVRNVGAGFKPAPTMSGSTLRVKSDDIESLISTIGELVGLDPKDFERLQAQALQLRMVPVGEMFGRFRKVVRDLSDELGKEIDIEISGESVKLDKVIADRLNDPILHMVRNAAGHGLESPDEREMAGKEPVGLIRLNAFQEGGQIIIEVSDNGRGISLEKVRMRGIEKGLIKADEEKTISDKALLNLIFAPGFSTMDSADSVSGRGVGMDVVKDVVTSLQGTVLIETKEGTGTIFRLQLPLTLAIIKAMVLEQSGSKIALPSTFVDRVINMTEEELEAGSFMDGNRRCLDLSGEGEVLPLVNLSQLFGLENKCKTRCVVLVRAGMGQKAALVVDSALGRQPLMVKPLDRFAENRYFSSASFVNDEVILVINTPSLLAA